MEVENVIISYQKEEAENIKRLLKIISKKNIHLIIVDAGDILNIEENVDINVLWPDKENLITENSMNNNSIVCKLSYQNTSILFTGDIEKLAEDVILRKYRNSKVLESTILKVAHHGSNSSTSPKWLEEVRPKIALIGVGEKNSFGHPNKEVLERLKHQGVQIYRTDRNGEIIFKIKMEEGLIW